MMGPPESGRLDDRQGSRRRSRAPWTDDPPPPPLQQHSPSMQKERTLDPLTPFVISEANAPLFQSVLTNWSAQACHDCRMVLAAPGVFTLPEVGKACLRVVTTLSRINRPTKSFDRSIDRINRHNRAACCRAGGGW